MVIIVEQKNIKISSGQMFVLLILARIMHTMIFHAKDFQMGTAMMLTLVITTALEILLSIPIILLLKNGGCDAVSIIAGNSKLAYAIRLIYSAFFLFISAGTLMYFAQFMKTQFDKAVTPVMVIIILTVAASYCAYLGIEGTARAGTIVLWTFLILFVVMAAVSEGEFDTLNLLPVTLNDVPKMLEYAIKDLSSSWWLPMLAALGPYLKNGVGKTVAGYLISKLVIIETLLFLVTLVLWNFVNVLGYPMLALGAYAKTVFIQRFDAINMFVWCLNCVVINGAYLFISAQSFGENKRKAGVLVSSVLAAVAGIAALLKNFNFNDSLSFAIKSAGIIVLGVIIPAIAVVIRKIKSGRNKNAQHF